MDSLVTKLKNHPNILNFNPTKKTKIINKQPFPILSYNPSTKRADILALLKKDDIIVIQSNEFTDKFTLIGCVLGVYDSPSISSGESGTATHPKAPQLTHTTNIDLYRFDIAISCTNANKTKLKYPDFTHFTATVNSIKDLNNLSSGESISRPITATVDKPFDLSIIENRNFVDEIVNSTYKTDTSSFDKKFRFDEFKSLADGNSHVFIWPHSTFTPVGVGLACLDGQEATSTSSTTQSKNVESYTRNRRNYARLKSEILVKEAASLIKTNMANIDEVFHIGLNKLNKALEFCENDVNALTVRGALYIHKKDYNNAIKDLEIAHQESGKSASSQDAKLYLTSAYEDCYRNSIKLAHKTSEEIFTKLKELDPQNDLVITSKEKQIKNQNLQLELQVKIKKSKDEAKSLTESSITELTKKREAVYKSILDTTSEFDSYKEKRRKTDLDGEMIKQLDKDVSKKNLGDILKAIRHFDTSKKPKKSDKTLDF